MQSDTQTDHGSNGRVTHAADGRVSTAHGPRTGRVMAIAAGALVVLLMLAFAVAFAVRHTFLATAGHRADETRSAKDAVDVVTARGTAGRYPLPLPGQTAGYYQSTIYARVDGYIGLWKADIGDRVKQGQLLATIETPELDQELVAARAKADASDAQVTVAESNVSIARITSERWSGSKPGVVSDEERDQKKADFDSAKAKLAEAKAQAALDRANAGRYQAMKAFENVTAPYDGVITSRKIDIGDLVTAGSGANTSPLYSLAQSNTIRVFVDVPQKATADMVPGLPAEVTTDQYPGRVFAGEIARSAMSIDPQTRTERVQVNVPNADLTLIPGMYVRVTFELKQQGLLEVPAAAILYRPDGLQVAVVGPGGRVDFRPVTIAKDDGDTVELAAGVRPGDRVALNISSAITPGQQVTAVEDDKDHSTLLPPPAEPPPTVANPADHPPAVDSGVRPPAPTKAPVPVVGPSGPGLTKEPAALPANKAPLNKPAGGTGND